jgi:D-hexose-6-phosphate mutarotase
MSSISEREDGKVFRIQVENAWADIALFGSTVIGWHPSSSTTKDYSAIFLSKDTKPGKAFRGGVPIVFPVFGEVKDHGDVPEQIKNCTRHGFCRDRNWKLEDKKSDETNKASVIMSLSSDDEPSLLEKFPCPFKIHHTVTLAKDTLESTLKVEHLSTSTYDSMPFHALFHTYLALPSATAKASGLKGIGYNDKVAGKIVSSNDVEQQGWSEEIDRVYQGSAPTLTIAANDESKAQITLERSKTIPDTTLWNPGKAADSDMGDLHQGGWREFVCAEPGHVASFAWLEKGKEWAATQTLTYKAANGRPSSTVDNKEKKTAVEAGGAAAGAGALAGAATGAAAAANKSSKDNENKGEKSSKSGPSDEALHNTCKEHYGSQSGNDDSEAAAARVIQRNYRKYVGEREADGKRLSPNARWGDAMGRVRLEGAHKEAKDGSKNDASSRWKRGGLLVGQLAGSPGTQLDEKDSGPVEGGPSLEPDPTLSSALRDRQGSEGGAPKREESEGMVGDVPGANENGKVDNIRSIAHKNQYGLKMVEKWTRGAPAQELSKVMEAQYWLEMVDKKHRYGSNLKHYHAAWEEDQNTKDNFFKWLDEGDGKDVSLPECPRDQLDKEQVTYLSSEKRANYIVDVKDGRLVFRRNGKYVDTTKNRWRDLGNGNGIVELGEEEKAELRRQREERAARRGHKLRDDDSSSSSSSSDDDGLDSEEEEDAKQRARHYGGNESQPKKGLKSFTPAGFWEKLLRKTVADNTWIYVYNSRHELFVGIKTTGKFQHSSFLYGGRVLSAGLLKAKDGYLTSLSPLSGHYRAGTAHFRFFVASLQDSGVNLEHVTLSKSLMMLQGLESYGKLTKKLKGKSLKDKLFSKESVDKEDPKSAKSDDADDEKEGLSAKMKSFSLRKVLSKKDQNGLDDKASPAETAT